MQRKSAHRSTVRTAALALVLGIAAAGASAQVRSTNHYLGLAVADTDLGTGVRAFGGGSLTPIWGWEAQLTSFGSEKYQQGFSTYKASAWSLGAYGTASWPIASNFTVFGKAGPHYVKGKVTGGNLSVSDSSVELGIGAGLKWQFLPQAAFRADVENIGGSGGDVFSIGVQFGL